jgi:hypothetical protein
VIAKDAPSDPSDVQLEVLVVPKNRDSKFKVVARGTVSCGDSSSGNYGITTRTAQLSKTDRLKEMRAVVKARHHLIVVLPLRQTQPLMEWCAQT